MIKSPLRYPGGKSKLVKKISKYIPIDFTEFREPFFGGGSVSFFYVNQFPERIYKATDINLDLVCFWQILKESPQILYREVLKIKHGFTDGKALFNFIMNRRDKNLDCFQRAVDFFILNRITYSGTVDSGGYSEQAFKKRFTLSSIERLIEAHQIVRHIQIEHADFEKLINEEGENVFIYLDPPYYSKEKSKLYGKKGNLHTGFDHERLYKTLLKTKHKWLLSYDDSEYIKNLYADFSIIEIDVTYGTSKNKKQKEILIANYELSTKHPALQQFTIL